MTETTAAPPPAPEKVSVFEDIIDTFIAPARMFARHLNGRYGAALIILTIAMGLLGYAMRDLTEAIMRATMEQQMVTMQAQNPNMSPDALEATQGMASMMGKASAYFLWAFTILQVFVYGLVIWVAGKIFGSVQELGAAIAVSTFAAYTRLVDTALVALQAGLFMEPGTVKNATQLSLSLARFLDPATTSPALIAVASRIGVFPLWSAFLVFTGLRITGRLSTGRAIGATLIAFVIGSLGGC